ncbi:hypothetical protein O6H91_Y326700 [Diphasiastrum complanatum]|nr:hypothetical protein O6H91_Y326700 [Diphasiastrum complanatum]
MGTILPAAVLSLFFFLSSTGVECRPRSFDFYYFVQQWPGSYCDTRSSCCYPTTGTPSSDFSIHGLWPNYNDGKYPSNCDPQSTFRPNEISDLQTELNAHWGSLACPSSDSERFWAHEWQKHGTCSSFRSEHEYFGAALKLKNSIDLLGALQTAGIQPDGGTYSLNSIQDAMAQSLGHTPAIDCNRDEEGNHQLYQVYVCVDTDGSTIIDCPILPHSSCPSDVEFPSFGSNDQSTFWNDSVEADGLHAEL